MHLQVRIGASSSLCLWLDIRSERSGLRQSSQCIFISLSRWLPTLRSINGYWRIVREAWWYWGGGGGVTLQWTSIPWGGGSSDTPSRLCYGNQDDLWLGWPLGTGTDFSFLSLWLVCSVLNLIEKWILSHFQGHVIWICFNFYYYYYYHYYYYYCYYYYYYYYYSQDVLYFIFQKTFVILAFSKNYVEAVLSYVG